MDDRLTPSVRRPRTRGARRRPPTPLAPASPFAYSPRDAAFFPTLSTSQRPATPQTVAGDGHTHYNALEERLHASGLKRSVVQAQLFPQAAASRAGNARFLSRKRHEAATALQDNQAVAEMEESLKHKPLVASLNVRPTGSALIPSRPASSSATALTRERQKLKSAGAKTARGYSSFAEAGRGVAKEPMTARDRYYIEQRASTVPGGERQTSRLRPVSREFVGDVKIPTDDQDKRQNIVDSGNNIRSQKPVEGGFTCTDAPDVPRRSDLLARRNEVRTLTDRLVENLTQQTTEESASAYGLSTPNGAVSRDSFFYLRRVDSNPYNLEVTTHSYINPKNYYTVSRLGITHFSQDGVEFQPLEKFERENYIYSLLVKLPFFKKYRTWKRFTIWKRAVNARKRMNAFVSLNNSLFILLPHLHDALFQLRHACLDLQKVNLFDFEHPTGVTDTTVWAADGQQQQQKTYTLSEFSLRLKAQKIRVERLVDQFISNSEMTAKTACENHLYSFLQNTGFNDIKSTGTKDGRKRSAVGTQRKESAGSTGVNICLDQQKAMTYTERATMKTQCRRLTKFLRVVEFLISDALLRMAILSTVLLKDTLATFMKDQDDKDSSGDDEPKKKCKTSALPRARHSPLFRVEVVLKDSILPVSSNQNGSVRTRARRSSTQSGAISNYSGGSNNNYPISARDREAIHEMEGPMDYVEFVPTIDTLRSQLETLVFNGLMAVTKRDRIIRSPMFRIYVEASVDDGDLGGDGDNDGTEVSGEGMDLDILIMEDSLFVETLHSLHSIVLDGYESAEESCSELSVFLKRYQEDEQFCKLALDPFRYLRTDVHDFRGYLDKYMQEAHDVDGVADSASCGLILTDRVKLNALLKPSPRKCLDALHSLIPFVFRQLNDTLMNELTIMNDRISIIPTTVEEFSVSLEFLRELQTSQGDIEDRYQCVRSLYHLLDEYRVKITDTDQMNAFMLTQKRSQLKTSMDLFENSCEQYTAKFGIELEARLPNLVSKLTNVSEALSSSVLFDLKSNISDTIEYLSCVEEEMTQLEKSVKLHFSYEKTLGLPLSTTFDEVDNLKVDLKLKIDMWKTLKEWRAVKSEWERQQFPEDVDIPSIVGHVEHFCSKLTKWEDQQLEGMDALRIQLKSDVEEYRVTMPILTDLRCPNFEERHFSKLHELLGFGMRHLGNNRGSGSPSTVTLGELVQMHLSPFGPNINRIATEATQERLLKDMLSKIIVLWERLEFEVKPHKESRDYYVLASLEHVYATLEESLISMTAVLSSKFLTPLKDLAVMWHKRLLLFQETFDAWIECQRKWLHLETIFSAPDIQKQLPNEGSMFLAINQFWKDLMRRTRDQKSCLKVTGAILIGASSNSKTSKDGVGSGGGVGQALLDSLLKHNASLERIEKSLEDYLETKRRSFPRFFFISSDELLEMLAHAKEPQVVQRHLPKCFDALAKLDISDDAGSTSTTVNSQDIVAMISPEGERVAFGRTLKARGNIEDWLNAVLVNMKASLHRHLKTCLSDYQHASREMWLFRHPAQAVAVVSYIIWARECEVCFKSPSQDPVRELSLWHQTICTQLSNLTRLVRTPLTQVQRRVVVSLVTTDVHFRDVVESLVIKRVIDATDFLWEQQLRYRWYAEHDECEIRQANCRIKYGYEYMGACSRLVITPLTDRCWMTITGALELRYGAAPSGPAGTGKTETSKDLAKALGILCIVINCSNQMSYKMMGNIFNGVIQAGAWVCLDEFNRIDIEVLSVVGQQMSVLRNARLINSPTVILDGNCVPIRDHHVIITMNPGYTGRTELPDNLKVSFRPVAMMVPDYALIAEILLFAEGFQLAKSLSRKVTKMYKLCGEQLSQQAHYDFGMRAVRSVLTMAGSLKRTSATISRSSSGAIDPASASGFDESVVLIKAMVGANVPKLTDEDAQLFQGILKDLFPDIISSMSTVEIDGLLQGVGTPSSLSASDSANWLADLEEEIDQQLRQHGLQGPHRWKKKLLHLFSTLEVRVGVVQTGTSGSGKSTALRILISAVSALRERAAHPDARFQRVVSFTLNPKAISMAELYGFFHPATREWTDGLASKLLRSCIMEKNEEILARHNAHRDPSAWHLPFYWITFDGPIDANWIESMNTVLDDNMTLCLANGERIKLLPRIQLLFEVADTAAASPATVSRLGVVYYHPDYLGWHAFVDTWVSTLMVPSVLPPSPTHDSTSKEPPILTPLGAKVKARILKYFDLFVEPGLAFLRSAATSSSSVLRVPILTCDLSFVATICHIFQALMAQKAPPELFASTPPSARGTTFHVDEASTRSVPFSEEDRHRCMDLMFIFSFTWSIGGNLNLDQLKMEFQDFLFKLISSLEHTLSFDILAVDGKIPTPAGLSQATGDIQDFFINFQYLSFSPWANIFLEQTQQLPQHNRITGGHLLVPTLDILKYRYLVELMVVDARQPVLLTGATGSGKSTMIHHVLDIHARIAADLDPSESDTDSPLSLVAHGKVLPLILYLSARTTSAGVQLSIESKFSRKRRTLLGAPANKQLVVVFVDDVNMPIAENHGAQPVIELLRQYLEFRGFYDREKFFWKDVEDSVLVAAGGLPGGGRQTLCPRFVRHFSAVFCLPSCDESAMKAIFNSILTLHLAGCGSVFTKTVKDALMQTVNATCELFQKIVQGLLPTPSKCHYKFNLRDVTKLMQGIVLGTRSFGSNPNKNAKVQPTTSTLTANTVVSLWAHEGIRVFRDRLIDNLDRKWFSEQLVATANRAFGLSWGLNMVFEPEYAVEQRRKLLTTKNGSPPKQEHNILFFSPMRVKEESKQTSSRTTIRYYQVGDLARYEVFLNGQIAEYNASPIVQASCREPLELVLFEDAMVHTASIARILMQPRGHVLLLGMGGCGKRSLARLAAFMIGYRCFEIEMKKDYGLIDFRDDLKAMMKLAALGQSADGFTEGSHRSCSMNNDTSGESVTVGCATPTVFLLNDSQLTSDDFLEDINTVLNGGDIPKLFPPEEHEIIISNVRTFLERMAADAKSHPTPDDQADSTSIVSTFTRKDCEDYFHTMVQNSFHFVLCMNPFGEVFRGRVRQFPALINCTTIDYFDEWPKTALEYVAEFYLSRDDANTLSQKCANSPPVTSITDTTSSPEIRSAVGALCASVHQSISALLPTFLATCRRHVYITSQHYLDLISLFKRIFQEKKARWETKLHRLMIGVVKLDETNTLVTTLQDELVALQPVLSSKTKEAEELLAQVGIDQAEAQQVAKRVGSDEAQVKQQQQEVAVCQADAQRDVDQALPALNAAVAALDSLDKKDITEVKGFVKPPQAVQMVMEAVCIMLGEKADWDTSKRILSRSTFMIELKEYDKDNIPAATLKRIRKYIENPDFAVDEVKKVSHAAMSLCMWVHAIDTYARVFKEVAPKRQRLVEMNSVLAGANSKLAAKQHELAMVMEKVRRLKKKCELTLAEKQRILDESELTQRRLQNAEKLTVGLDDERIRWKDSIELLKEQGKAMLGDSFLAAAYMSYLGPFDGLFRDKMLRRWQNIAKSSVGSSEPFTLVNAYGDSQELREWQLLGLPNDILSADNALCALKSKQRWPLMIDPQQQATLWIKRLETYNNLETVKSDVGNLMQIVEDCLRGGKPLLIEEVTESLDPLLDPVLAIKTYQHLHGISNMHVKLGDLQVETDMERFRLYLTTKLPNPHFAPDVFIRVNVVNFTVTCDGLEEQLLSDVVKRERMEVEERRHSLLASISRDQKQLHDIEIKILNLLSSATGNILDDVELIKVLETSKKTSMMVAHRLAESEATKQEVLEIRNQYHTVAVRGALLFFIIADLADIDPMYQYSLEYFTRLFNKSLDAAPPKRALSDRLESLKHCVTLSVYRNICRGLFQAHEPLFAFVICLRIMIKAGELNQQDICLLDQKAVFADTPSTTPKTTDDVDPQAPTQCNIDMHDSVKEPRHGGIDDIFRALSQSLPAFSNVLESYYREKDSWDDWMASDNPYMSRLPGDLDADMPSFLRLVIVKWLREDAFTAAVQVFIDQTLGAEFLEAENGGVAMDEVYRDSDISTPCLFILSPGADPISTLQNCANKIGMGEDRYHVISLGQGQGLIAEVKLKECKAEGHWLILQNVHLFKSWLPRLQSLVAGLKEEALSGEIHKDFRLFLAAYPVAYFPISILQNSVKVMTEPPKGIKANLQRSMMLIKQIGTVENGSARTVSMNTSMKLRLAFGLSFFHAVVRERVKFGPLGWNLTYDFSDADFVSVVTLQRRLVDAAASVLLDRETLLDSTKNADCNEETDDNGGRVPLSGSDPLQQLIIPWDALLFLAGEIYYGGRVTDEFDRRCLMAVLRRFCSAKSRTTKLHSLQRRSSATRGSLKPLVKLKSTSRLHSCLFSADSDIFCTPEFQSEDEMMRFVDALPDMDGPQVFGMHPNAHISFQRQQSRYFMKLVMHMQPLNSSGGNTDNNLSENMELPTSEALENTIPTPEINRPDLPVLQLSEDIQAKLPSVSALDKAEAFLLRKRHEKMHDPLTVVLQQELSACHNIVRYVDANLSELQLTIRGVAVMSVKMEKTLHSLTLQQVPLDWTCNDAHSIPSTQSLSQWITQLLFRCDYLHQWAERGKAPCNAFPLAVFSFPQGLFTAIQQRYARRYATPIHFLDFRFRVLNGTESDAILSADAALEGQDRGDSGGESIRDANDSAYLTGLVLEGARWNSEIKCLCCSLPGVMRQTMPAIQVIPYRSQNLVNLLTIPATASNASGGSVRGATKAGFAAKEPFQNTGGHAKSMHGASRMIDQNRTEVEMPETLPTRSTYSCPLYRTAMRKGTLSTTGISTNLVLAMELPCDGDPDYFVLNGAALVCSAATE